MVLSMLDLSAACGYRKEEREENRMTQRVPLEEMRQEFERVLMGVGFPPSRASLCARVFAENSLVGVASHGLNRFPEFVERIKGGSIAADAEPERVAAYGALEQWDGHTGPGPINALRCTERAMDLARKHGLGCVALRNTTHWMRAGAYAWKAAEAGFVFICWTNTVPNMPPWGAREIRLGNNPLVIAVPRKGGPVVLDMAMSQFSYGKLETYRREQKTLPFFGGFDVEGRLSKDPATILETERVLPVGYWKGAGLALLLDMVAAVLTGGQASYQIGQRAEEMDISQVFIAFDVSKTLGPEAVSHVVEAIIGDIHSAPVDAGHEEVLYPGERARRTREENLEKGVPVEPSIWKKVLETR
jgi:3-dehydro-L-gulonate 2-dehydrogenase